MLSSVTNRLTGSDVMQASWPLDWAPSSLTDPGYSDRSWLQMSSQLPDYSALFPVTEFLPVAEQLSDRVIERAIVRAIERVSEPSSDQASDRASERTTGGAIDRASDRAIVRSSDRVIEKSSD